MDIFYTDVQIERGILHFTGFTSDKKSIVETFNYEPVLFEKSKDGKWKSIYGEPLTHVKFSSIREAEAYVNNHKDYHGLERWEAQYLGYNFCKKKTIDFSDLRIYAIDIETTSENFPDVENPVEELLCLTIVDINTGKVVTFSSRKQSLEPIYENSEYYDFDDERQMILYFLKWWSENFPHVITGWYSESFDLPYMISRFNRIQYGLSNRLSPHGRAYGYTKFNKQLSRKEFRTKIIGIQHLDYIQLYKKFVYTMQNSYSLNNIAKVELNDEKLDHTEYETFKDFYTNDYELFLKYNQKDAFLIKRLEEKLSLLKLAVFMSYDAKCNFSDCLSPIRIWDSIIFNYLNAQRIAIPGKNHEEENRTIQGGRVKEPVPGLYSWITTFDLTSLYPSLIMGLNISPETLMDESSNVNPHKVLSGEFKNDGDYSLAANGSRYTKDKNGFLPVLVQMLFNERKEFKKKMLEKKKELEKIQDEISRRGL